MSDLISREFLQTAIHNFFNGLNHTPTEEDIQRYIEVAPSVENKGEWIPVSERLPEDGQSVNVTIQGKCVVYVTTATWDEMRGCFYNMGLPFRDVVAWRKLPEPYKAERGE